MKNKQELAHKADQTLKSLDNLQQLEANEFLHAKILHRMANRNAAGTYGKIMLRMAAVLCLFICLNVISYYTLTQKNTPAAKTSTGVDAFADAYGLNNNLNSY